MPEPLTNQVPPEVAAIRKEQVKRATEQSRKAREARRAGLPEGPPRPTELAKLAADVERADAIAEAARKRLDLATADHDAALDAQKRARDAFNAALAAKKEWLAEVELG